jgi:hypothetical protein
MLSLSLALADIQEIVAQQHVRTVENASLRCDFRFSKTCGRSLFSRRVFPLTMATGAGAARHVEWPTRDPSPVRGDHLGVGPMWTRTPFRDHEGGTRDRRQPVNLNYFRVGDYAVTAGRRLGVAAGSMKA